LMVLGLLGVACGSASSPDDAVPAGGTDPAGPASEATSSAPGARCEPEPGPEPSCGGARVVGTAAELVAEAAKLAWQPLALGKSGVLTLGDDLVATAAIEVDASLLVAPPDCSTEEPDPLSGPSSVRWCQEPLFREYAFPRWSKTGIVPGVTCAVAGPSPVRKLETCRTLLIKEGTTFRLRAVIEDMHPGGPAYWPFVEIERACDVPCGAGETRCSATQTCLPAGFATCAYCEGEAHRVCTCRDECGPAADGAECSHDTSPDTIAVGTCQQGVCTASR
jgi:hypothetical protein